MIFCVCGVVVVVCVSVCLVVEQLFGYFFSLRSGWLVLMVPGTKSPQGQTKAITIRTFFFSFFLIFSFLAIMLCGMNTSRLWLDFFPLGPFSLFFFALIRRPPPLKVVLAIAFWTHHFSFTNFFPVYYEQQTNNGCRSSARCICRPSTFFFYLDGGLVSTTFCLISYSLASSRHFLGVSLNVQHQENDENNWRMTVNKSGFYFVMLLLFVS